MPLRVLDARSKGRTRVPRIAEHRTPAQPTTDEQRQRVRRILRAAARHGAAHGLERVQMAEVAAEAGVALATLYRYFPSKSALFVGLMRSQVDQAGLDRSPREVGDPVESVSELLLALGHELLKRPLLTHAMISSNNQLATDPDAAVTTAFKDLLLSTAGIQDPTPLQVRLIRIIEQAWYGVLISALNGAITREEADEDTRLMCRLVLGDLAR